MAKVGHECFKQGLLSASECLLEFAVNCVDTSSLRLKMASLSTLSACYWRQAKFSEAINCMNLELALASFLLNQSTDERNNNNNNNNNQSYLTNIYRIYGNLASAYQRLDKLNECTTAFQSQLKVSKQIKDISFSINSHNSLGLAQIKLKEYQKALENFEAALVLGDKLKDVLPAKKLTLKQLSLIGECSLKLLDYERARDCFLKQLEISRELLYEHQSMQFEEAEKRDEMPIDDLREHWVQECLATLNLALLSAKTKKHQESVEYFEKCLAQLQINFAGNYSLQILEIYGRVYIGLINNCFCLKDNLRAALYAHSMLDFTLQELLKLNEKTDEATKAGKAHSRRLKYLKFIEMSACSKLATCYARQNRFQVRFFIFLSYLIFEKFFIRTLVKFFFTFFQNSNTSSDF